MGTKDVPTLLLDEPFRLLVTKVPFGSKAIISAKYSVIGELNGGHRQKLPFAHMKNPVEAGVGDKIIKGLVESIVSNSERWPAYVSGITARPQKPFKYALLILILTRALQG